jgi:cation diffusion facilitator CzcD-associated flavoprotein CzcO
MSNRKYEVVVLGAGVSGIYQIKCLTDLGMDAILLEAEADLGGTWYRNRYPGARFDSESYTYGYSFSKALLDEWHWKERFSAQPENLRYLNFVADKFDLRRHMRFNARVLTMVWDERERLWQLELSNGETYTARFVVSGIGVLSVPTLPRYEGMDEFAGEAFHTFWWPQTPVPLAGRRVGVIGTGATGIQVIAEIADKVGELHVFQRRPNWSTPLNNSAISAAEMAEIRTRYDEIFAHCTASPNGFEHVPDRRGFWNLTREERRAFWDELYEKPGFAFLAANFPKSSSTRPRIGKSPNTWRSASAGACTIRWWRNSSSPATTGSAPSGCHWKRGTSRPTTATTCTWCRWPRRRSNASRRRVFRPATGTTTWT